MLQLSEACRSVSQPARAFLSRGHHGLWINGKAVESADGARIAIHDPSTGATLGTIAAGQAEDIDRAVTAARAAFDGPWSRWTP